MCFRPLVFVAHSLSGLVYEEAVLLSQNNPKPHFRGILTTPKETSPEGSKSSSKYLIILRNSECITNQTIFTLDEFPRKGSRVMNGQLGKAKTGQIPDSSYVGFRFAGGIMAFDVSSSPID
jgi:hypothetical protein